MNAIHSCLEAGDYQDLPASEGKQTTGGWSFAGMVERYRRGKRKKALLGSHQKCWLWGRHVVTETLRAGRWPILELHLGESLPAEQRNDAEARATEAGISVIVEPAERLTQLCRSAEHQGYLAKMPPFPYEKVDTVLSRRPPRPLYALLDGVQDPYNFGAVVRSADVLGLDAVFVGERGQVEVTSLVARSSAGAVNHVPLGREAEVVDVARRLVDAGVQLVAASEKAAQPPWRLDFRGPTAIVIGNEGTGIRDEVLQLCREQVAIPQQGQVGSLNAAVAAGILMYEARRQRDFGADALTTR